MSEPVDGLAEWLSTKVVRAGEITDVVKGGCFVREAIGTSHFRAFEPDMTARYMPKIGDFWIVYPGSDNYQSISPREAFINGYVSKET